MVYAYILKDEKAPSLTVYDPAIHLGAGEIAGIYFFDDIGRLDHEIFWIIELEGVKVDWNYLCEEVRVYTAGVDSKTKVLKMRKRKIKTGVITAAEKTAMSQVGGNWVFYKKTINDFEVKI